MLLQLHLPSITQQTSPEKKKKTLTFDKYHAICNFHYSSALVVDMHMKCLYSLHLMYHNSIYKPLKNFNQNCFCSTFDYLLSPLNFINIYNSFTNYLNHCSSFLTTFLSCLVTRNAPNNNNPVVIYINQSVQNFICFILCIHLSAFKTFLNIFLIT